MKEELLQRLAYLKELQAYWKQEVSDEAKKREHFLFYALDISHINFGEKSLHTPTSSRGEHSIVPATHTAFSMLCTIRTQIKVIEKELKRYKKHNKIKE